VNAVPSAATIAPDLRALVDALPLAAALLGPRGEVLHANEAMRARAGHTDPARLPNAQISEAPWGRCVFLLPEETPDPQMQRLASLGFMLAGVCHEVSNPLAAIHSMVQILQSPRGVTPETIEKGLGSIAGNIVRILAITRKLGDFSRVTGDAPRPQPVDAAVREALGLLRHSRWGEEVEVAYEPIPQAVTLARPGELQQVLFNILLNAAQAMGGRGRIEVVAEHAADGQVRVAVRDSGPGIPEGDLERVFEPFFTTKAQGSGLGLSITNAIVSQHGGRIEISRAPLGGARFVVLLPLN
jgi:signal transduction histidine kinase